MRILLIGSRGFVGNAIFRQMTDQGHQVLTARAPRLASRAESSAELEKEAQDLAAQVQCIFPSNVDVAINASGLISQSASLPKLLGANAVWPRVLQLLSQAKGCTRLVHVSSAAVSGRAPLDENARWAPESNYALSKALGEKLLLPNAREQTVIYRPTSVQCRLRPLTRRIHYLARNRLLPVASPGDDATPQISLSDTTRAVQVLADLHLTPPNICLHPWLGWTTSTFLESLSGVSPPQMPRKTAQAVRQSAYHLALLARPLAHHARRMDLLMFGQSQGSTWLSQHLGQGQSNGGSGYEHVDAWI